jgi:hypothetical protein
MCPIVVHGYIRRSLRRDASLTPFYVANLISIPDMETEKQPKESISPVMYSTSNAQHSQ